MSGYKTIADWIRWSAREESWAPGSSMPSETALMSRFSSSRTTVRRAYALLEHEGMVETAPGRGRFLVGPGGERGERRGALYEVILVSIRAGIATGELPEGERIISQTRIAHLHATTRATARRAFHELAEAGLLRVEGHGRWYVEDGAYERANR